jgi:hypothetical protein
MSSDRDESSTVLESRVLMTNTTLVACLAS